MADSGGVYITQISLADFAAATPPSQLPTPAETAQLALDKLRALWILEGREMRHESSLSPYALLHKWRLRLQVDSGGHHYHLSGPQTAYGRGLTLDAARASYAMEIVDEARLSALMELVERDGEATHPFHPSACFDIDAEDEKMAALLADYRGRGIQFQFQDISPPYGIPCCKCFVTDMDGGIAKGTAASLNGRRAVISALTETPYPYPYGPPSGPGMLQLPRLNFGALPDYSSDHLQRDLFLVERLFLANGLSPIYVDLTREDLQITRGKGLVAGRCVYRRYR